MPETFQPKTSKKVTVGNGVIIVSMDEDAMLAAITLRTDGHSVSFSLEQVLDALGQMEIVRGVDQERIGELLASFQNEGAPVEQEIIARGEDPVDGKDAYLEYPTLERLPAEMTETAITWANLEFAAAASGVCPRCAATFDQSPLVCEDHDADDGLCETCGRRHAVQITNRCTNCTFGYGGTLLAILLDELAFLEHLVDHGVNPISPSPEAFLALDMTYEERFVDTDPFEARFSVAIDDDVLAVTVDDELDVVDVTREDA